jgi:membrane protease YdiL (CAAX protease family)
MNARKPDLFPAEPARGWLPWGALAPVLALVFVVATALAGDALISPFVKLDANASPADATALMAFLLVPFGLLLAVVLLWVRYVERRPLAAIGLAGERKLRTFAIGGLVGVASILGIAFTILVSGGFSATAVAPAFQSGHALLVIVLLLPCFAVQASVEEVVFRGWLLSVVAKKWGVVAGVIVSSAVFGLLHFSPGQPALVTLSNGLFAVFCCCWVLKTRNILGVMGWHVGWNWLLAVGFDLPLTGLDVGIPALLVRLEPAGPAWLTGGAQGPEGSIATVAYFVAAIGWLGVMIAKKSRG